MNFDAGVTGRALDFDFAVEALVEIGADNAVETDAAAGEFGFRMRGREAGVKKHFAEIALGEAVGGVVRHEAAFDGGDLDAIVIDAAAVVFDFDVEMWLPR